MIVVFFEHFVWNQVFKDSDGDGIGDLNGITSKLEYLNEIGVDGVWIGPMFKVYQHLPGIKFLSILTVSTCIYTNLQLIESVDRCWIRCFGLLSSASRLRDNRRLWEVDFQMWAAWYQSSFGFYTKSYVRIHYWFELTILWALRHIKFSRVC